VKLGINIFKGVFPVSEERIRSYIAEETGKIRTGFGSGFPPGYQNSRKLYRSFNTDPTRYRPSSEALWRRVRKGEALPEVNPVVDLTNLTSLRFQVPYGLYDLDKLSGDVQLITGDAGASYEGIRKDRVSLEGKIVLRDDSGPFGNPSSDSLRASTGPGSVNILQVIFFLPCDEAMDRILELSAAVYGEFFSISEKTGFFV
jgi:DNA/RNA-binding domain of Phe-tRNA-synthetase-like protein